MRDFAVLVPVKSSAVKSRLSGVLSESERREFALLLLSGLMGQLRKAGLLQSTYVISPDRRVRDLALATGARSILEAKDKGVNSAVALGIRESGSPSTILVLPSDLPLLKASEVEHIIELKEHLDVVIVPSLSFNGTNALVLSGRRLIPLRYDDDSFWNHLGGGAKKGLSVGVSSEPGLMFDIDSPADLAALARSGRRIPPAEFARRALR